MTIKKEPERWSYAWYLKKKGLKLPPDLEPPSEKKKATAAAYYQKNREKIRVQQKENHAKKRSQISDPL